MKLTMEQYGKVAANTLSLPRKNRDMLERALVEKRMAEDGNKFVGNTFHTVTSAGVLIKDEPQP